MDFHEGDYFRWSYKVSYIKEITSTTYWCCSCIARYDGKYLRDTFWEGSNEGRKWTLDEVEANLDLIFLSNEADLIVLYEREKDYYVPEDIVDLRHSNNSSRNLLFKKKEAKRSRDTMLELIKCKEDKLNRDIEYASCRLLYLESVRREILSGKDLSEVSL